MKSAISGGRIIVAMILAPATALAMTVATASPAQQQTKVVEGLLVWNHLGSAQQLDNSEAGESVAPVGGVVHPSGVRGRAATSVGNKSFLKVSQRGFFGADRTQGAVEIYLQKRMPVSVPFETPLPAVFGVRPYHGQWGPIDAYWSDGYTGHGGLQFEILDAEGVIHAANDLGWADGNHHRYRNGAVERPKTVANDTSAYGSGEWDSHPSQAGNLKATGELLPLLNIAYHCWKGTGGCPSVAPPSGTVLTIDDQPGDGRFQVTLDWSTVQGGGQSGKGQAISTASVGVTSGGLFWFFQASNPEVLVKVLNGCSVNGQYWAFASAGTNVGLTLTFTDTQRSRTKTYTNPDLTPAAPVQDTAAFACP